MAQTQMDAEIRARIDSFIEDISELVRAKAIESVGVALGGENLVPAAKRGPGRPRQEKSSKAASQTPTGARTGKRVRRSAEDLEKLGNRILSFVEKKPGCRMEDISARLKMSTKDLRRPVQQLLEEKAVKTKGQKRGTQYFAR